MSEQNLQKEIDRGLRAQQLAENPLMIEAREHIDAELWRLFRECGPQDTDKLAFIKGMHYIHAKYNAFLTNAISNGKIAQLNVESRKKSLRERVFG